MPYRYASEQRKYLPDFIVLVDDGHGDDDLLHLIVRERRGPGLAQRTPDADHRPESPNRPKEPKGVVKRC